MTSIASTVLPGLPATRGGHSVQKLRARLVFSGLSLTETTFIWMKGTLSVKQERKESEVWVLS